MKNLQKQKEEILIKLGEIDTQLEEGENIEAIKSQRWFFFKNKLRVSMDKSTGLLWANLNYFPYKSQNGYNLNGYNFTEAQNTVKEYYFDGIKGFRLPMSTEIEKIMGETFPFREIRPNLKEWHFDNKNRIDCIYWQEIQLIIPSSSRDNYRGFILPCSSILVDNTDYRIRAGNPSVLAVE
ncbi:MAG: hypothetical protein ATN32_06445 [Candidatus Epulonipiscium fishelsonii]|nr:MAG: hypothetical protein ATN32_06445 [Epulopiscium sp. AS2M-Bin002]